MTRATAPTNISHQPIMVAEVLAALRPAPGDLVLDCTLGGGGHAEAIIERIRPGGRLVGLDVDRTELARTETRLRSAGVHVGEFAACHGSFADARAHLWSQGLSRVDVVYADLGISTMQADDPGRGFSYKGAGPLDMRMDTSQGETAAAWLARATTDDVEHTLRVNADEPFARDIAPLLAAQAIETTQTLERRVRLGLAAAQPALTKPELKMSVRRVFQALRIAVNDEFAALEALLAHLPHLLAPGGRVAMLTFHSGEDRRVKLAFRDGHRRGLYEAISRTVTQSSRDEAFANRRSRPAKLRWAVRAR